MVFLNPLFSGELASNADLGNVEVEFSGGSLGSPIHPPFVESIEDGGIGNVITHVDQCGNRESDRVGEQDDNLTIEGILTLSQAKQIKRQYTQGDTIFVVSPTASGTYEITDHTLTLEDETNAIEYRDGNQMTKEQAVRFQLQFASPSSN